MSSLVPITPSSLVIHECRGLRTGPNENGERSIRIERLPDDDPSECRFQVTIVHPRFVRHTEGSVGRPASEQEPEIVARTNDESHAKRVYSAYAKVLGGNPPTEFDPPQRTTTTAGGVPRAEYDALLARIEALERSASGFDEAAGHELSNATVCELCRPPRAFRNAQALASHRIAKHPL